MADDEEAVIVACKTISCFIIIYDFSPQVKLIRLLKKNYGNHNFIHITNKLSCVSRSSRRAMSRLLYSMRDTARTTFFFTKMHGLDCVLWRVVTWRNMWNFGYIVLNRQLTGNCCALLQDELWANAVHLKEANTIAVELKKKVRLIVILQTVRCIFEADFRGIKKN